MVNCEVTSEKRVYGSTDVKRASCAPGHFQLAMHFGQLCWQWFNACVSIPVGLIVAHLAHEISPRNSADIDE